jgi:amidase
VTREVVWLDATGQAELVRSGQVSPFEMVDGAIQRIQRLNPQLNAVVHERFEKARAEAVSPDLPAGPFRGVPYLLKDLVAQSAGDPFHEGIRGVAERKHVASIDSELVRRFRAAGMVCVGRTNTPELGLIPTTEPDLYGPTRNPWDPSRSPGGSSGGSAAAVAAGMVALAHGNDAGGSIRIPAGACGIVGLKPTRGRTSLAPEFGELASGLVQQLALTRSVRDAAAMLDVLAGPAPGDPYFAPPPERPYLQEVGAEPGRLRVGVMSSGPGGFVPVHEDCVRAVEDAGALLESLGHEVEDVHPAALDEADFAHQFGIVFQGFAAHALDWWRREAGIELDSNGVEPLTWAMAELGRGIRAGEYLGAVEWLHGYSRRLAGWWLDHDLLLTPTLPEPPQRLGGYAVQGEDVRPAAIHAVKTVTFTAPFNASGQPAISLPLHWSASGLPIGVQLVAAFGREDVLIRLAAQLSQARPWLERRPPLSA